MADEYRAIRDDNGSHHLTRDVREAHTNSSLAKLLSTMALILSAIALAVALSALNKATDALNLANRNYDQLNTTQTQ